MDVEAEAEAVKSGHTGKLTVTGIVETEELSSRGQKLIKSSSARASVENMITVLNRFFGIDTAKYNIHVNFPGGMPVDGPSAGSAIITAVYSAILKKAVDNEVAMTGEISIHGKIKPVGGVAEKVGAAKRAGAKKVYIPKDNFGAMFEKTGIEIIPVEDVWELFENIFNAERENQKSIAAEGVLEPAVISASKI